MSYVKHPSVQSGVTVILFGSEKHSVWRALESIGRQQVDFEVEVIMLLRTSKHYKPAGEVPAGIKVKGIFDASEFQSWAELLRQVHTSYLAFIEESNVWTAVDKLQKQVLFLDNHPAYSFSCHLWQENYPELNVCKSPFGVSPAPPLNQEIDMERYFHGRPVHLSTLVCRNASLNMADMQKYRITNTTPVIFELLKSGRGFLQPFNGMDCFISIPELRQSRMKFKTYRTYFKETMELWKANPGNRILQEEAKRNIRKMSIRNLNAPDIRQEWMLVLAAAKYYTFRFRIAEGTK